MFDDTLRRYGLDRCSQAGEVLIIGVGPEEPLGDPVEILPSAVSSILFLDAAQQVEMIAQFMSSPHAAVVQSLALGSSHKVAEQGGSLDFRDAVAIFRGQELPALTRLSLGDMERLFNGHCYYGKLGDVAPVLAAAPRLTELDLYGHFELRAPVHHPSLQALTVIVDEIGVTGGPPSQSTLTNLLRSQLPALQRLELWLDDGDPELRYELPEEFLQASGMPALKTLGVDRMTADAVVALRLWAEQRQVKLHLEE